MVPTLPGTGILFSLYTGMHIIPFAFDRSVLLARRSKWPIRFYTFVGPCLTGLQASVCMVFMFKTTREMDASNYWNESRALMGFTFGFLMTCSSTGFLILQLNMVLKNDELLKYYHEMARFRVKTKEFGVHVKNDVRVFPVLGFIFVLRWLSSVSAFLSHPESPLFMWWILPDQWKTQEVHKAFAACYALSSVTMWSSVVFNAITMFLLIETAKTVMEHRNHEKVANRRGDLKLYRELQLLLQLYLNAVGLYIWPIFLAILIIVATVSAYGAIRFHGKVPLKLYMSFIVPTVGINILLALLLPPSAAIQRESGIMKRRIRVSLANSHGHKASGRNVIFKSLPTLAIKVGVAFLLERNTHLRVLGLISVNAITLLITL